MGVGWLDSSARRWGGPWVMIIYIITTKQPGAAASHHSVTHAFKRNVEAAGDAPQVVSRCWRSNQHVNRREFVSTTEIDRWLSHPGPSEAVPSNQVPDPAKRRCCHWSRGSSPIPKPWRRSPRKRGPPISPQWVHSWVGAVLQNRTPGCGCPQDALPVNFHQDRWPFNVDSLHSLLSDARPSQRR